MALNIKNQEVERLAAELAAMTGETKTQAIRSALEDRKRRLELDGPESDRREELQRFLASEIWSQVPRKEQGRRLTRTEEESILGYGPHGV